MPPSAALKTHPDRVANDSPERGERTRKFQLVNDAYYTLSDPTRRRDYDAQRKLHKNTRPSAPDADPFADPGEEIPTDGGMPGGMPGGYSWAWDFFTNQSGGGAGGAEGRQRQEDAQFEDVFEEMMREEGMAEETTNQPTGKFWGLVGGVSGGALGFIVANVPGLVAGAVAGNRLGAVRDAKGKSVWSVFQVSCIAPIPLQCLGGRGPIRFRGGFADENSPYRNYLKMTELGYSANWLREFSVMLLEYKLLVNERRNGPCVFVRKSCTLITKKHANPFTRHARMGSSSIKRCSREWERVARGLSLVSGDRPIL